MPDGNTVCLPYLAALIRLADEIDVAAARNPRLLYDIESLTDEVEIIENKKVRAVRELAVTEDACGYVPAGSVCLLGPTDTPDRAENMSLGIPVEESVWEKVLKL